MKAFPKDEQSKQDMTSKPSQTQERLAELKAAGCTPINAIKAICAEFGISLEDAKREFSACASWQQATESADKLHAEVIAALARESKA